MAVTFKEVLEQVIKCFSRMDASRTVPSSTNMIWLTMILPTSKKRFHFPTRRLVIRADELLSRPGSRQR